MSTSMTQDDFSRLTSQLATASATFQTAMTGLVGSNAQLMRSAADADSNIGLSKSQSFLPSELRDAKATDNTVDQDHRGGLPPRDRDINPLRAARDGRLGRDLPRVSRRRRPLRRGAEAHAV